MREWLGRLTEDRRELALRVGRGLGAAVACAVGIVVCLEVYGGHYAVKQWLIWRLLPLWGYSLLWVAACIAGGASILRWLVRDQELPALEHLLFSMTVGVVLFVFVWNLGGTVCLFRTWMAVVLPVALLALGWFGVPGLWRKLGAWRALRPPPTLFGRVATTIAVGWGLLCVAFVYLEALPLASLNFDASWYHLPVAQDYAREGCVVPFPGEDHKSYPHLASLVHTWAFLVPLPAPVQLHWMLALHLEFVIVVWRIVGAAAAAHWMLRGEGKPGLWPFFFLFPSVFIYDQCIGGSADHFLGFFAAPIFLATARALRELDWRWGALAGIVAGGHILTKYQAVYLVVAVAGVFAARLGYLLVKRLVLYLRRSSAVAADVPRWRAMLLGPLSVIVFAAVVSSPHYVKNVVFHSNPLYPLAMSVFPSSHPRHPPGEYQVRTFPRSGPFAPKYQRDFVKRQVWATGLLFTYAFKTANRAFTEHRPYMGALFSLLLPCVLFVPRPRRILLGAAMGYLAFMTWANTAANDRYLLAFYDIFIAVAAALAVKVWKVGWLGRAAVVPLVALQLFWGADAMLYYGAPRLYAAMSLVSAGYSQQDVSKRLAKNGRQLRITEATPPDAVIMSRNYRGILGLDRTVLSDVYVAQKYIAYTGLRDARDYWELLHERGVTHLLYPKNQRRPVRWNNTVLFADLVHRYGKNSRNFGGLMLVDMPPQPPPHEAPMMVLSWGNREYPNGLYRVEQLDVDNTKAKRTTPKPKPVRRASQQNLDALVRRADALALGRPLTGDAASVQAREFVKFEQWGREAVYLRRK